MQLKSGEFEKAAMKRDFQAWLVYGPDQGRVNLLATALLDRYSATGLEKITRDAAIAVRDPALISDHLSGATLFARASVLRLRDADDKLVKSIEPFLARDLGEARLVIEADELTSSSKLKKLFEASPTAAVMTCWAPTETELAQRAGLELTQLGVSFETGVPQMIAALSPPDTGALVMECRKLAVYAAGATLTQKDVEQASGDHAEAALSDLCLATASGQTADAIRAFHRLMSADSAPIMALRSLQRHFQRLHAARLAIDAGVDIDGAMSTLRPPIFWKEKVPFKAQLGKWRVATLEPALARLIEAERQIKSGAEETATVGQFILDLTLRQAKAGAQR